MHQSKGVSLFPVLIWLVVAAAAFGLLCLPLIQNLWASYHWQTVPCETRHQGGYAFDYQDKRYISTRIDFWDSAQSAQSAVPRISDAHFDDVCFMAPGDPTSTVLRLDAYKRWDRALKPLFLTAFLSVAATGITWHSRRRSRRRPASNPSPPRPL